MLIHIPELVFNVNALSGNPARFLFRTSPFTRMKAGFILTPQKNEGWVHSHPAKASYFTTSDYLQFFGLVSVSGKVSE